jgi:TetR/AcrR family transcriptional repressor of nem operon
VVRKPEFEREAVLEGAMVAFWERGYGATSMADILAATGLSKSSLYAGFGGKRELFIECYDRYRIRRAENLKRVLDAHPAPEGVRAFFEDIITGGVEDPHRFGCMSTNQAAELASADPEVSRRVGDDYQMLEDEFTEHLRSGQEGGTVPESVEPRAAACALVTAFAGFQLTVRAGLDTTRLRIALDHLLSPLESRSVA